MAHKEALKLFETGNHPDAVRKWKDLLALNTGNDKAFVAIQKGKEIIGGLEIEETKKKELSEDLEILSTFYRVSPGESIREKKGNLGNAPPGDIRIHPDGRIVVADETRHRVQFFSKEGDFLSSFGEKGEAPGKFNYVKKLFCAPDGTIYVADAWNHRIQQFDAEGVFLREFGAYGDEMGQFNEPHGITMGRNSWLYILDRCNHRVQVLDKEFKLIGSFGRRGTPIEEDMAYLYSTLPDKFSLPAFEFPTAIETDTRGDLYIADCNNHRIQKFNLYGDKVLEWGVKGSSVGEFMYPQAIAIDEKDNIFIADMNNRRVQRFTSTGKFLYSITIPGGESDSMAVPVALACKEGILYVGLGFSPKIIVFKYESGIPPDFGAFEKKIEREEAGKTDLSLLISECDSAFNDTEKAHFPQKQIDLVTRLEKTVDSLEEDIKQTYKEWVELSIPLVSSGEKKGSLILQGAGTDTEFDESHYELKKKNIELERSQKAKLTQYKRVYENIYKIRSLILSKCDKESQSILKPFYDDCLNRIKILASFLAQLLSEREKNFLEMEGAYKVFANGQRDKRCEFRRGNHLLSGSRLIVSQVCFALGASLSILKDWVVFLKNNNGESSQWHELFHEIFMGEVGSDLEIILGKSGYDWELYDTLASEIQLLVKAFHFSGMNPSGLIQCSFAEPFKKIAGGEKKALFSLLFPLFSENSEDGAFQFGPYNYLKSSEKSEEFIKSASATLSEFAKGGVNLGVPLKSFMENEMVLLQHKANTEAILNSPAASDEKVYLSQEDRLMLLDFQEKLNLRTVENLFSGLRWDYRSLLPMLFYLKENEPEKIEGLRSALDESIGTYLNLQDAFQKNGREKEDERKKTEGGLASGDGLSNYEERKELEINKRILSEAVSLYQLLPRRLAQLIDFHEILNGLIEKPISRSPGTARQIKIEPDLIFGEFGNQYGKLHLPAAVNVNGKDHLVVCSLFNHFIRKFTLEGIPVDEMGGYGAMPTSFKYPSSIAFDSKGNAFILELPVMLKDSCARIQKISPSHEHAFTISGAENDLLKPRDLILDAQERLWVSDLLKNKIFIYSSEDGHLIKSIGGEGEGPGEFRGLWGGLALMKNGDIAVSESGNCRIQILDLEGNHKTFCAMGNIKAEKIYRLARGPGNTLLAADFIKNYIYVFDDKYRLICYFGGFGNGWGKFYGPAGMKYHNGMLFVCDYYNHRIQRFSPERFQ